MNRGRLIVGDRSGPTSFTDEGLHLLRQWSANGNGQFPGLRFGPTAAVRADSGVPHRLLGKSAGLCGVVLETLAQAHHVVNGVADLSIELSRPLVRGPNLQVHLRAAEIAQSPLGHVHEQAPKSLTPMIRVDREVVDPASVAFVTNHDRSDQLAALFEHEKVVPVSGQLAVNIPVGVVPWSRELADRPERHERFTVARSVRPEHGVHENCLPVRMRFSAAS